MITCLGCESDREQVGKDDSASEPTGCELRFILGFEPDGEARTTNLMIVLGVCRKSLIRKTLSPKRVMCDLRQVARKKSSQVDTNVREYG